VSGRSRKKNQGGAAPGGLESLEEASEGSLAPSPELEEALREAANAVSGAPGGAAQPPGASSDVLPEEPLELDSPDEIEELRSQFSETKDRLLRLRADFDNFRRRAAREHQDALQFGPQNLVKDLLSVVDNLDRAIDHARQSEGGDLQSFLQGVELVARELIAVLGKHHVSEIEALGKPFNPALHEAMAQVSDVAAEPNTVVEVLEKGYQIRDRLVRPTRVVVAKPPDGPGDGGGEAAD
jgi:molecular chaperone GrpE